MATLVVYPNGFSMGQPGGNAAPVRRGQVSGWSPAAARRNTAFLKSVQVDRLTGIGVAFTLTMREAPASPRAYHAMRYALMKRLTRLGAVRLHWVTEWQRRGVPHLHGMAYFEADPSEFPRLSAGITSAWLGVAGRYGAERQAQYLLAITDALGWAKYLGKHAARGVQHYQRHRRNIPPAWAGVTGRIWGHGGDWPRGESRYPDLPLEVQWTMRRIARRQRISDHRAQGDWAGVSRARRMLNCPWEGKSSVRGVDRWFPEADTIRLLDLALAIHFARSAAIGKGAMPPAAAPPPSGPCTQV